MNEPTQEELKIRELEKEVEIYKDRCKRLGQKLHNLRDNYRRLQKAYDHARIDVERNYYQRCKIYNDLKERHCYVLKKLGMETMSVKESREFWDGFSKRNDFIKKGIENE